MICCDENWRFATIYHVKMSVNFVLLSHKSHHISSLLVDYYPQDMEKLLETIQSDVRLALVDHSPYSVGRLHQTLTQVCVVCVNV